MTDRKYDPTKTRLDRRKFLAGATIGGAGLASLPASPAPAAEPPQAAHVAVPPSAAAAQAESGPVAEDGLFVGRTGSDYMVDVIKALDIGYVTTMPGSSFRGLHEALINYGGNERPELLTCLHEEIAVAMGHGYAKVSGKPIAALLHSVVGLQHAAMAVYNAWCDRVPVVLLVGNTADGTERRPVEWLHSAQSNASVVRDYVKWDDQPASLIHFGESLVRAVELAMTPPCAPVMIVADGSLQEHETTIKASAAPKLRVPTPPVGERSAIREAARLLVEAQNPVILADRLVRSDAGMAMLVELAEAVRAPVVDLYGRMNMPSAHYLNQTSRSRQLVRLADLVLGLEVDDFWGSVNSFLDVTHSRAEPIAKPTAKLVSISAANLLLKSNFQDFQRRQNLDLAITGDGEATLPYLLEEVRRLASAPTALFDRESRFRDAHKLSRERALDEARYGWDASPISLPRLCAELGQQIGKYDWGLVSHSAFQSFWPQRLWNFTKHYQALGSSGGAGVGYVSSAGVGAALAHKEQGRLAVSIVGDGDLMCCPQSLWTAAHHNIPLLSIVHNNRAYHQETMHVQRMALRRSRGIDRAHIGTEINEPLIDFAGLARSMGVWSAGPVSNPRDLPSVLKRAVEVVRGGEPALIDVVTQPR